MKEIEAIKIKDTLQVGAIPFKVIFNTWVLEKIGDRANVNLKEQVIRLRKETSTEYHTVELLHEVLHIINDTLGKDRTDEEENTIQVSNLLAQALLSLGVHLDFSNIKEEKRR